MLVGLVPHPYSGRVSFVNSNGLLDSALDGVVFVRCYFYIVWLDVVTRCLAMLENGRGITGLVFFYPRANKGPGGPAIVIFFIIYYTEKYSPKSWSKILVLNVSTRAGKKRFCNVFTPFFCLFINLLNLQTRQLCQVRKQPWW